MRRAMEVKNFLSLYFFVHISINVCFIIMNYYELQVKKANQRAEHNKSHSYCCCKGVRMTVLRETTFASRISSFRDGTGRGNKYLSELFFFSLGKIGNALTRKREQY